MKRKFLWTTLLAVVLAPTFSWAQQGGQYYHPHMWEGGWHGWFLGPVMMILFLAALVALVVFLVRWLGGQDFWTLTSQPPGKTPLDILDERFARGEIDKEEFEERRQSLRS
ncbi:SHOCT domain-containing protein [Maritimibacter sp. 55A14]|uniref:SHOCT domain-containing protein n=1 Tax=Maritimibacter sp. 55A14 TaxID=2174844 RepID=UPI001304DC64|nr:SHOCT domain-containing protein [Maritimibacter sp. 55A14]